MNTKHQPATPLPWSTNHDSVNKAERVISARDGYGAIAQVFNVPNAAYIAHACNSYPKLVEALRDVERWLGTLPEEQRDGSIMPEKVREILRELGEG